jgi:hypothetical protein
MTTLQTNYPSTSTVALACNLASLAHDATLLAGRAGTAVSNATTLDLDHQISGTIRVGSTAPTVGSSIELWAYTAVSITSGTPTYPDGITGTDANKTLTSSNVKYAGLKWLATITVDAVTNRDYPIPLTSIAARFGGTMPMFWGPFVTNGTGQALNGTQVDLQYHRSQAQSV